MSDATEPAIERAQNPKFDRERARGAAQHPKRTQRCEEPPGKLVPLVNRAKCEGKADCVAVCPYGVFEVGTISEAEFRALPVFARVKVWVHGKKTAFTPKADACRACGMCVVACPEKAISLVAGRSS